MSDPHLPALHVRPPRGWVNDPNGLARVDGRWHVFFQHNPAAPVHDAIRWGHASSADLLRWEDEPDALLPREGGPDAAGCWTGCLVDDGGVPTAVYSGVTGTEGVSEVVLARSDRTLRTWAQDERAVVPMPDLPGVSHVRDPFVFTAGGRRWAVQGAGHPGGTPRLLLFSCDDLTRWEPCGELLTGDDPVAAKHAEADVWECPNVVEVDGRWVLVVSLWRWTDGAHALSGVSWLTGDLDLTDGAPRFRPSAGGPLDDGPAFYAPQALPADSRTLLWGWSWELREQAEVDRAGWAGCLTFPRELRVDGDVLTSVPAAELTGLRREELHLRGGRVTTAAFELETAGGLHLALAGPDGERPVVDVPPTAAGRPARVLVDGSVVEVFAGGTPVTTRAYATGGEEWVVRVPGAVRGWRLGLPG
ncbi:glycoside hydrolase family 32 protein [Kineococcus sp. SYSU DK004]|uniref:glycoside hydrolase family 32 protein n=1 Tax=Kineococcus sp. SYSU DK004 TaxID=3383125 RepID=UPI003D7D698E